jgi:N-methylhydantoinase B/oxoprolinase/acetone carboxylase alpha subunit
MQEAVKHQLKALGACMCATHTCAAVAKAGQSHTLTRAGGRAGAGDSWRDGDVVMSNHPCAGGSHLPDITVITPVFAADKDGVKKIAFFVASRGRRSAHGLQCL